MTERLRRGRDRGPGNLGSPPHSPPPARNGDALAKDAISGDPIALSDLLRWAREMALRHALARTQDLDDAEDVAQEVLIRVLNSIHSFRFHSKVSSWVYRITENQIQSQFRSRASVDLAKKRAHVREVDPNRELQSEVSVDAERLWDTVNAVVEGLPELQDRTFRLVALQDFKPCEAAQALGKSQTNVRASLSRARVKIRERLFERAPALMTDLGYTGPDRAA